MTAANFSVIATGCPPSLNTCAAQAQLRETFSSYGDVVHMGVALDNRELILAMQRRSDLLARVHDAGVTLIRAVDQARAAGKIDKATFESTTKSVRKSYAVSSPPPKSSRGSAAMSSRNSHSVHSPNREMDKASNRGVPYYVRRGQRALDAAVTKLRQFDTSEELKTLQQRTYNCAGTVFVTFNAADAAANCANDGVVNFEEHTLLVRPAPAPDQVMWENLQVSKRERTLRQICSTALLFIFSMFGAAVIAFTAFFKPVVESLVSTECLINVTIAMVSFRGAAPSPPNLPPSPFFPAIGGLEAAPAIVDVEDESCRVVLAAQSCELTFWQTLPVMLSSTVLIIAGHILIFILAPMLSVAIERPHFFYQRELTVFLKLAFFQVDITHTHMHIAEPTSIP